MSKEHTLYLYAPGRAFVAPYICRELPAWAVTVAGDGEPAPAGADFAVMLSGTEVYAAAEGELLDESTPIASDSPLAAAEARFAAACEAAGVRHAILRCANTVGTGMQGFVQSLARSIYRGTFLHFAGNDARLSAVHAVDVAAAVRCLAEAPGAPDSPLNITDGADPSLTDLADALAARMNGKHISTLSTGFQKWLGRILYGRELYRRYTTTLTFDGSALRRLTGLPPVTVTRYLRTHNYDESSL